MSPWDVEFINYYDVLSVDRHAAGSTIKKAYYDCSRQHHPDKNPDNVQEATEHFKLIALAHEVLKNPTTRSEFDEQLIQHEKEQLRFQHKKEQPRPDVLRWEEVRQKGPAWTAADIRRRMETWPCHYVNKLAQYLDGTWVSTEGQIFHVVHGVCSTLPDDKFFADMLLDGSVLSMAGWTLDDFKEAYMVWKKNSSKCDQNSMIWMKKGCKTRLCNLKKAADLNGVAAVCKEWLPQTGRWRVQLETGATLDVKPANLHYVAKCIEGCPTFAESEKMFKTTFGKSIQSAIAEAAAQAAAAAAMGGVASAAEASAGAALASAAEVSAGVVVGLSVTAGIVVVGGGGLASQFVPRPMYQEAGKLMVTACKYVEIMHARALIVTAERVGHFQGFDFKVYPYQTLEEATEDFEAWLFCTRILYVAVNA